MHGWALGGGRGLEHGRISPSSRCQLGFVAMQHPVQHRRAVSPMTARAAGAASRASPALRAGIRLQAKPSGAACCSQIAETDSQTRRRASVQAGLPHRCCRARICEMCANLIVYLLDLWQKCTILPLFRESPFSVHSISALFTIPATGKHTPFVLSHSIHKLP